MYHIIFMDYLTALSVARNIASNFGIIVNNKLEGMWKEAVVA
jgi:hypothetical protein